MSAPAPWIVNVPALSDAIPVAPTDPTSCDAQGEVTTPTCAVPGMPPAVAVIVARVPVAGAVYLPPGLVIVPPPVVTAQVVAGVVIVRPNWSSACAESCCVPPLVIVDFAGETVRLVCV